MTSLPVALRRGTDRYDVLLILVASVFFVAPFEGQLIRVFIVALLVLIFLFALWTAGVPRRLFVMSGALSTIAMAAGILAEFGAGAGPRAVFAGTSVVLCALTIAAIVVRLTPRLRVTSRTLAASVSIYLLLGMLFAYVYSLIGTVRDGGFFAQPGPHDAVSYLYYSFVTLATVGFGDLTSNNDSGRMLTVLEALSGQLYLVTVVAVVVSNRGRK
ncbi:ion channel [Jatrophihabitans sp. DSM 45814]